MEPLGSQGYTASLTQGVLKYFRNSILYAVSFDSS